MKKIFSLFAAMMLMVSTVSATTIYCKMTHSWWTINENQQPAAVAIHHWGGTTAGTTWPGVRMTPVEGQEGTWSYDVPADVEGLIFVRVNAEGDLADWGAKTADLTLQTDGKNLYTITSETAVWGNPGCTGEWSVFVPSEGGEGGEEEQGVVLPVVGLGANFNGWKPAENLLVPAEDSLSASIKVNLGITDTIQFKIVSDGKWLSLNGEGEEGLYHVHRDWAKVEHVNIVDGRNFWLTTDAEGEYIFTWTYADSTLLITFPEKPETVLADGFYLIGNINGVEVPDWTVENINKNYLLARNTEATENEEYKIEVTLAEGDAFQVVSVANDVIAVWYPGGTENNYVVDAEHAGQSVIYFRPNADGGEDWFHNKIYVAAAGGTGIDNTAINAKAEKMIKNGMLLIIKGDKTYNIMGQIVK
jgi:hypothetical protein